MESARIIGITTYPENPRGMLNSSDIIDDLFEKYSKYKVAYILHDKDGVKPHHEILIYSPSTDLSLDKIRRNFNLSYHHVIAKTNDSMTNEEIFKECLLYLCHLSSKALKDDSKYKYNPRDIISNFDHMPYFIGKDKNEGIIIRDIRDYGISVHCNKSKILDFVIDNNYLKVWRKYRLDIIDAIMCDLRTFHRVDCFSDSNVIDYDFTKVL